jgi:galactose mutarotase-like enzyme
VSDQHNWLSISSDVLSAQIDPRGAQLSTLRDRAEHDLMWNGDPSIWAGRAPLLFPIVGALAGGIYRLGSNIYHLPRHGFARGSEFELVDSSAAAATFGLRSSAASLEVYPFKFELEIRYALDGDTLSITTWVRNLGDSDMPASFGYHPAFSWPLPFGQPRSAHFIEFENDEPDDVRRLDAAGLLTPERHATPIIERRLPLVDALFQEDVIILDRVHSRFVTYGAIEGPRIRVGYPDAPWLGIWSKPGAGFICIEPWHGVADPLNYEGDFRSKPGIFLLTPGAAMPIRINITLLGS